ncbi:Crp/Fnr family transcriptional regulator [Chryseobacterium chendengshani]|uniref:Crp/Fnr family transcriptional regulator n=1 Tax=Chryseobacterium sp. LJ756 TaxID=2864113 RepID=UPI001C641FB2|nr:Crp/Fnr family transcriptional regulator [Chryseobacterium sp. LJ756]MBW7674178.1 Crp/Fnr family transcriptional regulator [Chryseobacterium sp. LJ756]
MNVKANDTEWEKFSHLFKRIEIPAHTELLTQGQFSDEAFIILKGCLRCFTNDGQDITYQFFFENEFFFSVESFLNDKPSSFSIESIEPCIVYSISKNNFHKIITSSEKIQKQINEFSLHTIAHFNDILASRLEDDPEKKYLKIQKDNPKLLLRVPQYYIASFLGISTKTLSQVQNKYNQPKNLS